MKPGFGLVALACCLLAGCTNASQPAQAASAPGSGQVFAALGASETSGFGLGDQNLRLRVAWPQLFYQDALPTGVIYYNFSVPGITTQNAITDELPAALSISPTVVSVFFGVDDIARGVSAAAYEANLRIIVSSLRRGGRALVLVANTPVIDNLPAVLACTHTAPPGITCALPGTAPTAAELQSEVGAYNAAVARVAAATGAVVVDLHAQGDVALTHPEYVATDGLHPTPLGHQAIARIFEDTYRQHAAAKR